MSSDQPDDLGSTPVVEVPCRRRGDTRGAFAVLLMNLAMTSGRLLVLVLGVGLLAGCARHVERGRSPAMEVAVPASAPSASASSGFTPLPVGPVLAPASAFSLVLAGYSRVEVDVLPGGTFVHALSCGEVATEVVGLGRRSPAAPLSHQLWRVDGDALITDRFSSLPPSSGHPTVVGRWPSDLWLLYRGQERSGENRIERTTAFHQWQSDSWQRRSFTREAPTDRWLHAVLEGALLLETPDGGKIIPLAPSRAWEPERLPAFMTLDTRRTLPSMARLRPRPSLTSPGPDQARPPFSTSYTGASYATLPSGDLIIATVTCALDREPSRRDDCQVQLGHVSDSGVLTTASFAPPSTGQAFLHHEGARTESPLPRLPVSTKGQVHVLVTRGSGEDRALSLSTFDRGKRAWQTVTIPGLGMIAEIRTSDEALWVVASDPSSPGRAALYSFDDAWHDEQLRGRWLHAGAADNQVWASRDQELLRRTGRGTFETVPFLAELPVHGRRWIDAIRLDGDGHAWVTVKDDSSEWLYTSRPFGRARVCSTPPVAAADSPAASPSR